MRASSRVPTAPDPPGTGDRGAVTVEAALALGALAVVFGMVLAGVTLVIGQVHCTDAAREAARLVARGEPGQAAEAVRRIAPADARHSVGSTGDEITVEVTAIPLSVLPGIRLRAAAYAVREPDDQGGLGPDAEGAR
jgi:hypothetical protein